MTKFMICKCGWKSKPYANEAVFMGVGGHLSCPICTRLKGNSNIEVYGSVVVIQVPDNFNPSKRKNKKSIPFNFFCNILGTQVNEVFCQETCSFGKDTDKNVKCYWKTAMLEKSSEAE